jgi:hypothetical protein
VFDPTLLIFQTLLVEKLLGVLLFQVAVNPVNPMLFQFLKENALSGTKIQVLLRELTKPVVIHHHGATRAALWYLGLETVDCSHDRV